MKYLFAYLMLISEVVYAQKSVNACDLVKRPLDCDKIEQNVKRILRGDDDCVAALLDSIYLNIARTNKVRYLIALDSIVEHADGSVSEYLMDIGKKLFYHNLPLLTEYLLKKESGSKGKMEEMIVESMSTYIATTSDRDKRKQQVLDFVNKQREEKKIDEKSYKYLMELSKRFDPKIVD